MSRAMKDSGIEWIGKIPEDWEIGRLKDSVDSMRGGIWGDEKANDENDVYCVRIADFNRSQMTLDDKELIVRNVPLEKQREYLLNKGDLLVEKSGGGEKTPVGSVVVYTRPEKAIYTNFIARLRTNYNVTIPNFIKYVHRFLFEQRITTRSIKQTTGIQNLDLNKYLNEIVTYPTIPEQQKIAAYLDDKTSQIDAIIENTKQSIAEFKKYKQALITETVTKGLNPDVKMKDSGIEWIGEIPEHWDAWKLKQLFEIKKIIAGKLGYDILSITQNGLKIKDISSNEGQISADYSKYQIVDIGDFAMNHMDLLTGWVDCATFSGVTSPDYRVFKSRNPQTVYNDYYKYVFQMCYSNKIFYGLGQGVSNLGRWRLPTSNFLNFFIPHPPVDEQQQIADFLDEKTAHIDSLIADKQKMVQELENYKKSLIYEYVTGKKEV